MKAAAVYPDKKSLGIVADFPEPKMESPTAVKLRILNVGVCGTDREIASFHYGTPPEGSDYLVIGHECLGEVIEVGPEVEDYQARRSRHPYGAPPLRPSRMHRLPRRPSRLLLHRRLPRARHHEDAWLHDRVVVDEARYMNSVPAAIRDVAVLVEPLTIAEKALACRRLQIQQRLPWVAVTATPSSSARARSACWAP